MSEVRIIAKDPPIDISVPLGDGVPTLTGAGLGGWKSVEVIDDEALTVWEGQTNPGQDIPLMLDGWGLHPKSVQQDFDTLLKLSLVRPNSSPPSPPPFQVWGPVHFPGRWWVLPENGIELSTDEDEVGFLSNGDLYRQALTLHMVAFNHDVFGRKKKRPPNSGIGDQSKGPAIGPPVPLTHTTTQGETFSSVAADHFNGQWWQWAELAEKNPSLPRSPFMKLPPNRVLVL